MAWRCTQEEVRVVIDGDDNVNFSSFIDTANALTDKVSARDSDGLLSVAELKQIEIYLAAHFYEYLDPQYASEKTGDASGDFQGEFGKGLESNKWGQAAILLDETGYLAARNKGRRREGVSWLGLPPSEQTDYEDRN